MKWLRSGIVTPRQPYRVTSWWSDRKVLTSKIYQLAFHSKEFPGSILAQPGIRKLLCLVVWQKTDRTKTIHSDTDEIHLRQELSVKPVLNWANVCSPNILRTVRRTMIRFLIELLVRRTWFGQFDELYFILNWLVMRCKLRPELAADAQQTAWSKM